MQLVQFVGLNERPVYVNPLQVAAVLGWQGAAGDPVTEISLVGGRAVTVKGTSPEVVEMLGHCSLRHVGHDWAGELDQRTDEACQLAETMSAFHRACLMGTDTPPRQPDMVERRADDQSH